MYIDPSAATIPSYTGGLLGHAPSTFYSVLLRVFRLLASGVG